MKIAISATGPDIDAPVDPIFGRTRYFLIVDPDTMEYEAVSNPNTQAMGSAGIQSAQLIGNAGAEVLITGQVGPNAFQTLSVIGVRIHHIMGGTSRQAIGAYKAGRLPMVSQPHPGYTGMRSRGGMRPEYGGPGRGRRGSMGGRFGGRRADSIVWASRPQPGAFQMSSTLEIQALKKQSELLAKQLEEINKRLRELETLETGDAGKPE